MSYSIFLVFNIIQEVLKCLTYLLVLTIYLFILKTTLNFVSVKLYLKVGLLQETMFASKHDVQETEKSTDKNI